MHSRPQNSEPQEAAAWAARLTAVEELVTHLQRTVEDLHHVVLAQQKQLDACDARLRRLERDVQTVAARSASSATQRKNGRRTTNGPSLSLGRSPDGYGAL